MNIYRILEVHNQDALDTLREFLISWWKSFGMEALLAPIEAPEPPGIAVKVIKYPAGVMSVNPFTPIMPENSAALLNQAILENPGMRLGAILRPCELRTFFELQKRWGDSVDPQALILIGVDCPGTYSISDYSLLIQTRTSRELAFEALQNASEGGLKVRQIRTACLMCDWPAPRFADLTIGTIGIPTDQVLLLISRDETSDAYLRIEKITNAQANEYQVSHRETIVGGIADMRAGMRRTLIENIPGQFRFNDIGSFFAWLANCSLCGKCLHACPIFQCEVAKMAPTPKSEMGDRRLLSELVHLSRWLASCSGCGVCAEYCIQQVPFSLLISAISHRIQEEMSYHPGDPIQALPWVNGPRDSSLENKEERMLY